MSALFGLIEPTVTVGNIIEITSILGGGLMVLIKLNNNVIKLGSDMAGVQIEIKKIGELMTAVAVQTVRLDSISERLNLMDARYDALRKQ